MVTMMSVMSTVVTMGRTLGAWRRSGRLIIVMVAVMVVVVGEEAHFVLYEVRLWGCRIASGLKVWVATSG
jgi:hypothetical protein